MSNSSLSKIEFTVDEQGALQDWISALFAYAGIYEK